MQRVKNIDYDEDDLYDDDDYAEEQQGYTAEDRENFATLTPVVRAELEGAGVQASTSQIEEALWHYYWDVAKSVAYLQTSQKPQSAPQAAKKEKPKSKFDQAAEKSAARAGSAETKTPVNDLAKKADKLKIDQAAPAVVQTKIRSKGLDVAKVWSQEAGARKQSAAFVVIGHVDHGKSTLMGRLLLDTGAVAQREIDKYKKQATEMGKASFALAWVMDTGSEERERGVTVDIAQHYFSTDAVDFTILDAPGHRDFVPNMIGGASMADFAVLVVDANQLESGMKGQTREHILLARAVGLRKIIVAVNKLDSTTPPWSQDVFSTVSAEVTGFLRQEGFGEEDVVLVPCSGLSGDNVARAPTVSSADWIARSHKTLLRRLEESLPAPASPEQIKKPVRLQVTDVFRGGISNPLSVSGRITSGNVQVGDVVMVQPSGETASIKAIEVNGDDREWAVADQICDLHLVDIDPQYLRSGDVVCDSRKPVPNVKSMAVSIAALETLLPQGVDVHFGRLHVPGAVSQLMASLDDQGEVVKKKPRLIKAGHRATVRVNLASSAPLEVGDRIVLRADGTTIASGNVLEIST